MSAMQYESLSRRMMMNGWSFRFTMQAWILTSLNIICVLALDGLFLCGLPPLSLCVVVSAEFFTTRSLCLS